MAKKKSKLNVPGTAKKPATRKPAPKKPRPKEVVAIPGQKPDPINPPHYTQHPSGIECIQITEYFNFCLGNAIKYIWRAGQKGNAIEDLKKAEFYIKREIGRLNIEAETWGGPVNERQESVT